MPRRASSRLNPVHIIGISVIIVLAFIGGKLILKERSGEELSGNKLNIRSAVDNANSLRGNEYVVEGTLNEQLHWDADAGQVVSLKVKDGSEDYFLGIQVPASLSGINLEREQDYAFKIRFRDNGIAIAQEITRR